MLSARGPQARVLIARDQTSYCTRDSASFNNYQHPIGCSYDVNTLFLPTSYSHDTTTKPLCLSHLDYCFAYYQPYLKAEFKKLNKYITPLASKFDL